MFRRLLSLVIFGLSLISLPGWAQVQKVKGQSLIAEAVDTFEVGDQAFVVNPEGKRVALVEVVKVKGNKILAKIIKGKVEVGWTLQKKGGIQKAAQRDSQPMGEGAANTPDGVAQKMGLFLGMHQNSMSVAFSGVTTRYRGNSYSLFGFMDIPFSESLALRLKGGWMPYRIEQGSVGGSFSYLGLEGSLQYYFSSMFWVGGGGAFLFTVSKSSNIPGLDASSATNSFFYLGLGADIPLGRSKFLPVSADYAIFPGGSGVSANSLIFRAGYGWRF